MHASEVEEQQGQISINTENILPIIKRWLYSEKEIFVRELVSNAADAILKLEKIALVEDVDGRRADPRIDIQIDTDKKTLTFSDTGLGMTADEIRKYINQVAFSGVEDFVAKYQNKDDEDQVIGHFGLGFYSSFMVGDRVTIDSLSYRADSVPAFWESSGDANFKLSKGSRSTVGSTITLHVGDENKEVLDLHHLKGLVSKYCGFLRYPVFVNGEQISDSRPIWTQNASQLQDKDYKDFFRKLFPMDDEPLFWVHLNLDFPLKLRGVLYFPKLGHEFSASEGQVKLFCNQVFVEDNCKELIPEYLTLLKGVIDCPDLPLNVSRSALQKDANVRKIAQHITKKVADKFAGMFRTQREEYQKFWDDINPFVKYAMIRDTDFKEKMLSFVLYKTSANSYLSFDEYLEKFADKTDKKIIYVSDPSIQGNFVKMLQADGIEAIIANRVLDQHFLPYVEMSSSGKYKFARADSDISRFTSSENTTELVDPVDNKTPSQRLEDLFRSTLGISDLKIKVDALKASSAPAVLQVDENMRRLHEMSKTGGLGSFAASMGMGNSTLIINKSAPAIKNLLDLSRSKSREQEISLIVKQIYDLAALQQGQFQTESMQAFIERSAEILSKVGAPASGISNIIL